MTVEAMKSHILHYLHRRKKPSTVGEIKRKLLGSGINTDDVIHNLFQLNYISLQDNKISLSEEGEFFLNKEETEETARIYRLIFENEIDLALLEFLTYRKTLVHIESFPQLLKDHAPDKSGLVNDGPLEEVLFKLEKLGYIESPQIQWYGLTPKGNAYYKHAIAKFERNVDFVNRTSNSSDSSFTKHDIKEMESKLDNIIEQLAKVHSANEIIWTDMKEDFEELKNLYGLSKKNWRQLLIGKLAEWTAGGMVNETVSKQILESIKPTVVNLLK